MSKMLKLYVALFSLSMSITEVLTLDIEEIASKFQQNDYEMKLEWGEAVSYNKQELKHFHLIAFKHNRTTTAVNLTIEFNFDIGNNLEFIIQSYRFASNEYRLFPLRFQIGFCYGLSQNLMGTQALIGKCGNLTGCSMKKGIRYHFCNWAPDDKKLPPYFPTGRYMSEVQALYKSTELFVMRAYASVLRPVVWF